MSIAAKKKSPTDRCRAFLTDASRGGRNQKSKSRQGDYIKEPESSAVKGEAAKRCAAPLTARTDAANNSDAGSHPDRCDPLISLIIFLVLQKQ